MKYKVYCSGFAYVEADSEETANSEEEAKDIVLDDDGVIYSEYRIDSVEEVDEFVVDWDN